MLINSFSQELGHLISRSTISSSRPNTLRPGSNQARTGQSKSLIQRGGWKPQICLQTSAKPLLPSFDHIACWEDQVHLKKKYFFLVPVFLCRFCGIFYLLDIFLDIKYMRQEFNFLSTGWIFRKLGGEIT